jgi:DNA-binding response OmpR family regulator
VTVVLVVEQDPQVLVLAESVLQAAGYEVVTATNYDGAIALLDSGLRPEIAFVERNLGEGLSGLDVARSARDRDENIKVIYTSAEHVSDGTRALFVKGAEFLPKPYTPEQLTEMIHRLLGRN